MKRRLMTVACAIAALWCGAAAAGTMVSYWDPVEKTSKQADCVMLAEDATTISGWTAVSGTVRTGALKVEGSASIVLCDGCELTAGPAANTADAAGIEVGPGATLVIYGQSEGTGHLVVTGGSGAAGIGSRRYESAGTISVYGGRVTATGGDEGAGIGGGAFGGGGDITIAGGAVTATGVDGAAGIGGAGGSVTISGGVVTATGSMNAAGIGAGNGRDFNTVTISGGIVTATGGDGAAGIGGGFGGIGGGGGGVITISGGTVTATGGNGGADIGSGQAGTAGAVTISGGSVLATRSSFNGAPTNSAGQAVHCVTVKGLAGSVSLEGLAGYGVEDIDPVGGKIGLWLPNGDYAFAVNGVDYVVKVDGTDSPAIPAAELTGVTVNGVDVGFGAGVGWHYDSTTHYVEVTDGGDYVLSGTNTAGKVMFAVDANAEVTLSNLCLACTTPNECCLWATNDTVVTLYLAGTNTLDASRNGEGVCIENDCRLTVTAAPGFADADAVLVAKGGPTKAGIAVSVKKSGAISRLVIASGTVEARGGDGAAGIGGSFYNNWTYGGYNTEIAITGGRVRAYGGAWLSTGGISGAGAGIGSAANNYWGGTDVDISGGFVEAHGGSNAAGIGGGCDSISGAVKVSGGTVFAGRGDSTASDMISGYCRASGDFRISGGSVVLANGEARPQPVFIPSDASSTQTVWCVTVEGLGGLVSLEGLEGYGTKDIFAVAGKVCLWLPDGSYEFKANGVAYIATVSGANTTAVRKPVGVTVNGVDVVTGAGTGWAYDDVSKCLKIAEEGEYTLSGGATNEVYVDVCANVTLTLDNLTLARTDGGVIAGLMSFSGCENCTLLLAGTNRVEFLNSRLCGAGIFVRSCKLTIDTVQGVAGSLSAKAGLYGAGIGGYCCENGEIVINGGDIAAYGGYFSAGIGVGQLNWSHHQNGPITINGGHVFARGANTAPAIGGEYDSTSGDTIRITGGTVDAGGGCIGTKRGAGSPTVFTGGSVYAGTTSVRKVPTNAAGDLVYRVTVEGLEGPVSLEGLAGYGVEDVEALNGRVYLWLPNGHYRFSANGAVYVADVQDSSTVARLSTDLGVTVNGVDVEVGAGEGWAYANRQLTLSGEGPFLIGGTNTAGEVVIVQEVASTVTISNLVLATTDRAPYAVRTPGSPRLLLAGVSELSATGAAAVEVPDGFQLAITNAPGCADASLTAVGGAKAAAIGGGPQKPHGMINIFGGRIIATGGENAAAIGSGGYAYTATSVVGEVRISGGYVTASAGFGAAALGGGYDSIFGDVVICGGTVDAGGADDRANDIGNGWNREGRAVTITGGSVLARAAKINLPPTDGAKAAAWCVTVEGLAGSVSLEGLEGYGTNDIVAVDGKVYLYLPDGDYQFKANGEDFHARVDGAATVAQRGFAPTGVTVNGADLNTVSGTGWTWNRETSVLACAAGEYVLSGFNTNLTVNAALDAEATAVASNLVLNAFNGPLTVGGTTVDLGSLDGLLTVTGGSVRVGGETLASNLTERVWCVSVDVERLGVEKLRVEGLDGYGVNDIGPLDGRIYLWLPNGTYVFEANGVRYYANVFDAPTNAATLVGFTVNGQDLIAGRGTGWEVVDGILALDGSVTNAFELAGELPQTLGVIREGGEDPVAVQVFGSVLGVADDLAFTLAPTNGTRTVDEYAFAVKADGSLDLGKGTYYFNPEDRYDAETLTAVLVADETWQIIDRPADTGVTVNELDIGGVAWTADDSACHFNTNDWILSFNQGLPFHLAGTNLTERSISLVLEPNELSVAYTNLVITSNGGTSFTIAEGCDPAYWGFFTNAANTVLVGEGTYAFDPTGRTLDDLTVGRLGANLWRVVAAGAFKARATVDGVTYSCLTLNEALKIAGKGGVIELDADIDGETLAVPSGASFALVGNGHAIAPAATSDMLMTVASNCLVSVTNVVFDGRGVVSNALASVEPFGALALTDCTVRGFCVPEGTLIGLDSSSGSAAPALTLANLTMADNAALGAVGATAGMSILAVTAPENAAEDVVVLAKGAEIAFTNAAPTAKIVLNPLNAADRVGETLVRPIAGGVALDPANVRICAAGYMSVGDGQGGIVLDTVMNRPFAVGAETTYVAYRTFDEAIAATDVGHVAAVYYENVPEGVSMVTNVSDITVGADTNAVLSTVYRMTPDGTNTVWDSDADKRAVLAGHILVRGSLTLENVEVVTPLVLDGGILAVGAGYDLGAPTEVSFVDASQLVEGTLVVTSSVYSVADLQSAFRVQMPGYVLTPEAGGLAVRTTANSNVAKVGDSYYHALSVAFAAAAGGQAVEVVVLTNALRQATVRDAVPVRDACTVESGRTVFSSLLCDQDAFGRVSPLVSTNVRATVKWEAGSRLILGEDAVLAPSNVVFTGTLELDGTGLLDLAAYDADEIAVKPLRTGKIAANASGKLRLAGGLDGELVTLAGGDVIYRTGSFSASFVETGNGTGYIAIEDYGTFVTNWVTEAQTNGSVTRHYSNPATGVDTDLTFGVLYLDLSDDTLVLPPTGLGANPSYKTTSGGFKSLPGTYLPEDTKVENDMVTLKNYDSVFTAGPVEVYYKTTEQIGRIEREVEDDDDDVAEGIRNLFGDLFHELVDAAAMAALSVINEKLGKAISTIKKIIKTIKGIYSIIKRLCAAVYIRDGEDDSDYYDADKVQDAFNKGGTVHFIRDVRTPDCMLNKNLTIDMKGSAIIKPGFVSCWINLDLGGEDFTEKFLNNIINKIVSSVSGKIIDQLGSVASHAAATDHTSASDSDDAWLTVKNGAVTLKNFKQNDWTLSAPLIEVWGDGDLTVESSEIAGFTTTSGNGVVCVTGTGRLTLSRSSVTDNRNALKSLANVYVDSGSCLTVADSDCRVGISGQTEGGDAFARTDGKSYSWSSIYLNDAHPGDDGYEIVVNGKNELCWKRNVPTPFAPSFPDSGDEWRTGGMALNIRMITKEVSPGVYESCARIWGAPTNGVKGAWYYLKSTLDLGSEFLYLPDFKWQATKNGAVEEMQQGPEGSCCDVPAPSTVTNRFFRFAADAEEPGK